jgi:hypothetical protein
LKEAHALQEAIDVLKPQEVTEEEVASGGEESPAE